MKKLFQAMLVSGVLAVPFLAAAGDRPSESASPACDCGECKCGDGCKCSEKK